MILEHPCPKWLLESSRLALQYPRLSTLARLPGISHSSSGYSGHSRTKQRRHKSALPSRWLSVLLITLASGCVVWFGCRQLISSVHHNELKPFPSVVGWPNNDRPAIHQSTTDTESQTHVPRAGPCLVSGMVLHPINARVHAQQPCRRLNSLSTIFNVVNC